MSGKVPKKNLFYSEDKNTLRAEPRQVAWSNPNEVRAQGRNASQKLRTGIEFPGTSAGRHVAGVSSSRRPDVCSGATALGIQAVSWSNPNNVRVKDTHNTHKTQRLVGEVGNDIKYSSTSGGRRVVSSSRGQSDSPGTAEIDNQACHREGTLPGAVRLGHIDNLDDYEEQATVASRDGSDFQIVAHAVDTEEEARRLYEQDRRLYEQDQRLVELLQERNQLRQVIDNAVVVDPIVITDRDAENGNEQVAQGTANYGTLPRSEKDAPSSNTGWGKCCDKFSFAGRVLSIILAIAGVVLSALTAFKCKFLKTESAPLFEEKGLNTADWARVCAIIAPICGFIALVLYLFELFFVRFRCARFIQIGFVLVTEVALCFTFFAFNTEEYRYDRFKDIWDSSNVCSISNAAIYTIIAFGFFLIAGSIGFCTPKPKPVFTGRTKGENDDDHRNDHDHEDMMEPKGEGDEQASDAEEEYPNEPMYDASEYSDSVYDASVYDEEMMAS